MPNLTIPIAADHRGFALKSAFIEWLKKNGYTPKDLGTHSEDRCDSLDYAMKMAEEMKANLNQLGVLICGTGNGIAMVANRYSAIRAAVCTNVTMARLARQHNDANILAIGAHITGIEAALDCLETFLKTPFLGGRYAERRDRFTALGGL
jgi:ribose 5-phosphate isomerase B